MIIDRRLGSRMGWIYSMKFKDGKTSTSKNPWAMESESGIKVLQSMDYRFFVRD